jgi:hypothetical protein
MSLGKYKEESKRSVIRNKSRNAMEIWSISDKFPVPS